MTNSSPWVVDGPFIEIDGLPWFTVLNSMVMASMANCERHNQMVSQSMACYVSWPQRSEHHCHQAWGGAAEIRW